MVRLGLLLLGAWVGVLGMLVHRQSVFAGGLTWPWGLIVVLAVTVVVARASSGLQRVGAAWFALGWVAILMIERLVGGDSYLVATDWVGWTFMLGSLGLIGWEVVHSSKVGS